MSDDEMYVRQRWAEITVKTYGNSRPFWICSQFEYLANGPFETEAEMWQAARAFTEAREEEIRQVEEEIAHVEGLLLDYSTADPYKRILLREIAILADLKRGFT